MVITELIGARMEGVVNDPRDTQEARLTEDTFQENEGDFQGGVRSSRGRDGELAATQEVKRGMSREWVLDLPIEVHRSSLRDGVEDAFFVDALGSIEMFHDGNHPEGVRNMAVGYRGAVEAVSDGRYPSSRREDPAGIYLDIEKWVDKGDFGFPETVSASEADDIVDAWSEMTDVRKMFVVGTMLEVVGAMHDAGMPAESADFDAIKRTGQVEGHVTPRQKLLVQGAEGETASNLLDPYVEVFWEELGFSEEEARVAIAMGEKMTQDTIFDQKRISGFAILDQTAALFGRDRLRKVGGLVREGEVNGNDFPFTVQEYIVDFMEDRCELAGVGMDELIEFVAPHHPSVPEEWKNNPAGLADHIRGRLEQEGMVAREVWGGGEVEFAGAFNLSQEKADLLRRAFAWFEENYWNTDAEFDVLGVPARAAAAD